MTASDNPSDESGTSGTPPQQAPADTKPATTKKTTTRAAARPAKKAPTRRSRAETAPKADASGPATDPYQSSGRVWPD